MSNLNFKHRVFSAQRKILYRIISRFGYKEKEEPSQKHIDIAVMVTEKDLRILPLCLQGIRKCVNNIVDNIYIISPKSSRIEDFCLADNLVYVEESSILGYSPKALHIMVETNQGTVNRSGWLFQQLVKLSGRVGTNRHILFVDSDHVLLKEHLFLTSDNKTIFYMSEEYNWPYFENMRVLLNRKVRYPLLSYVAHKMLFDKEKLRELHKEIENAHPGQSWDEAIINCYDRCQKSGFSEFELYGCLFGKDGIWRPWKEKRLHYAELTEYTTLVDIYVEYNSVTFPSFLS